MVFTKQEIEVFLLKVDGLSDTQIAEKLKVSKAIIQRNVKTLKKKVELDKPDNQRHIL